MASKPQCVELRAWLRANLGKRCLAPLTGTDAKALDAAVHIVELWAYDESAAVIQAFGLVVDRMQPHTQVLAYHAIAKVTEWHYRDVLWEKAGLRPIKNLSRCSFEPGGSCEDLSRK
ncbi:MAG TPA: hypothetical protein VHY22_10280 [Chthoniobacteraceae bacterium]|jgi:hypothetical protein|nr:hypothetical protein [Chthoniobacteraceae bacterium]